MLNAVKILSIAEDLVSNQNCAEEFNLNRFMKIKSCVNIFT